MLYSQPEFSIQPVQAAIQPDSLMAVFRQGRVLLRHAEEGLCLPTFAQLSPILPDGFEPFVLRHAEEGSVFSPHPFSSLAIHETDDLQYEEIGIVRSMPYEKAALILSSWHLWSWYLNHRFCGSCGHPNQPDEKERALRCTHCNKLHFPVICPAIIVAITCGDRILLAKNAQSTYKHYALIAGYMEVGETLEHAVHREVKEEVGITLQSLRYLDNQPWGISGSHMFAFHATADDAQPILIQESELSDARWFHRDELSPRDSVISIANILIERFRQGTL